MASGDIYESTLPQKPMPDALDWVRIVTQDGKSVMVPKNSLGGASVITGLAYLITDPGTPVDKDLWLCMESGEFTNFGNLTASAQDFLVYNVDHWEVVKDPRSLLGYCVCNDTDPTKMPNPLPGQYFVGIWDNRPWFINNAGTIREFVTVPWEDHYYVDLVVNLYSSDYTPTIGDTIEVSVPIQNAGTVDDTGVSVEIPAVSGLTYQSDNSGGSYDPATGVWTIGQFPSGQARTLRINFSVDVSSAMSVSATISGDADDKYPTNNSAVIAINAHPPLPPIYYGRRVSSIPPDSVDIKAGTKVEGYDYTVNQFIFPPDIESQFLWAAIPDGVFPDDFNKWMDVQNTLNQGNISTGNPGEGSDFMKRIPGLTSVDGVDYVIYMSNYLSYFKNDLKIYKQ